MNINRLFEFLPWLEALSRNAYWRSAVAQNLVSMAGKRKATSTLKSGFSGAGLLAALRQMGIKADDAIIAHSSMKELASSGLTANDILSLLMNDLCPNGTLICPTFPLYAMEPQGKEKLTKNISKQEFVYDVQKTRPWTGELGRALMKMPGARRSIHPLNSITACGAMVDRIFAKEKIDTLDLPCGPNSTWASLFHMNAKIIMLGVDLTHSLTMIHVAEDCYEAEWPVKGWYRERLFKIKNQGCEKLVTVRERHPKWAMSYAERKLSRDLYASGVANRCSVGSLEITVVESEKLIEFLNNRKKRAYPYHLTWLSNL